MYNNGPPYKLLSQEDLEFLPIPSIADTNGSFLFMWTTGTHVDRAIKLINHWGFKFISVAFVWRKITQEGKARLGMGYYSRAVFEYLLLATKGKVGKYRRP